MSPDWNDALYRLVLDSSLRVALVAAIIALILAALRVRSSGVRHAAWTAVLCAMLLMPVLPYCIPSISVPMPVADRQALAPSQSQESALPIGSISISEATAPSPVILEEPIAAAAPSRSPAWPGIALAIYGTVFCVLSFRLLLGLRSMTRIARSGAQIIHDVETGPSLCPTDVCIHESALVAVPFTVGILFPRIILPVDWRQWPAEKLKAVLAHEIAHLRRRDPLISFLAHLNRCIFWFHPLAWWLERKLATTAELACDDAAVRALGARRRYAEILLDMAEAVRLRGSRFSWQGVGVHGNGLLGRRIDRILRGDLFREISRLRKILVVTACAAAILAVFACRRQAESPAALQPDPKFTQLQADQKARSEFYQSARSMTREQVAKLQAAVKKNPEDLANLEKLLIFYAPISVEVKGEKGKWAPVCAQVIGEKECVAARRQLILWLIEHHPDNKLAGDWAHIYPTSLDPLPDPEGYAEAKKLWLAQSARPAAPLQVLRNAARFFEVADKPLAEKMLLQAQTLDPKGNYSYSLGRLYALVLLGANSSMPLNVVRTVSEAEARSPYTQEIRKKLAESTDADLLFTAGQYLYRERDHRADPDIAAFAKSLMERAQRLKPDMIQANLTLLSVRFAERNRRLSELLRDVPRESQYQTVSALPESERLNYLPELASTAYMMGEYYDYTKDPAKARESWDRARKYAQGALQLASKLNDHPERGTAIYVGNLVLGALVFREGNRQAAVNYLMAASQAPSSEDLDLHVFFHTKLTAWLLKYGERASVIEFLERVAKVSVAHQSELLEAADQIRKGVQPIWYPREQTN